MSPFHRDNPKGALHGRVGDREDTLGRNFETRSETICEILEMRFDC